MTGVLWRSRFVLVGSVADKELVLMIHQYTVRSSVFMEAVGSQTETDCSQGKQQQQNIHFLVNDRE